MKEAVPKRVRLESSNCCGGVIPGASEHVMPLKQLVQDDPVDEAAEADPEQDAAGGEATLFTLD